MATRRKDNENSNAIKGESNDSSRAEYVATELRKAIRTGSVVPGQRVREADVAKWLGVSRTPVREALHRLTESGLLEQTSQGLVVVSLSYHDVVELYLVRKVLVGAAAGRAARHATKKEVKHLRSLIECMEHEQKPAKLKALNFEFHDMLVSMANNSYLSKSLQSLTDAIQLLPGTTLAQPGMPRRSLDEHRAIVDAVERQDSQAAETIARDHIQNSLQLRLMSMFDAQ